MVQAPLKTHMVLQFMYDVNGKTTGQKIFCNVHSINKFVQRINSYQQLQQQSEYKHQWQTPDVTSFKI